MDLSRIARGGTPLQLDRPRLLFYDVAAAWLLVQKYGNAYLPALYRSPSTRDEKQAAGASGLVLQSIDALVFFLWVGLQADAKLREEELTLEQVGEFLTPRTYPAVFNAVITALMRDTFAPERDGDDAGKADAAAARPAVAAEPRPKRKVSTSRKPSGSASPSSAGRRNSSGPRR